MIINIRKYKEESEQYVYLPGKNRLDYRRIIRAWRSVRPTPSGYSNVVEVTGGWLVFITGQIARDASGNLVGPQDLRAQVQQVFENLKTELAAVGADFSHVVKLTILAVDTVASQLFIYGEIRDCYINRDNPPASGVMLVPKMVTEGALIDIAAIAHLPE